MVKDWNLRLRILLLFGLLAGLAMAGVVLGGWVGYRRLSDPAAQTGFWIAGTIACFAIFGACASIWLLFDEHVAKPSIRLAADLRARTHAGATAPIPADAAHYLGDLGPAAEALANDLTARRGEIGDTLKRETARIKAENDRLERVLRDVPAGVMICTKAHRIVLYNTQATRLLNDIDGTEGALGLNRPLFEFLADGPICHGLERLQHEGGQVIDVLCATRDGRRFLQGRMRLVDHAASSAGSGGYVLTLHDVTRGLTAGRDLDRMLRDTLERLRRQAANLAAIVDAMKDAPRESAAGDLENMLRDQTDQLLQAVRSAGQDYAETATSLWPMLPVASYDFVNSLAMRLMPAKIALDSNPPELCLTCDAFALVLLFENLILHQADRGSSGFALRLARTNDGIEIDLDFKGQGPSFDALERQLSEPIAGGYGQQTGHDVLLAHSAELWPENPAEGQGRLRLSMNCEVSDEVVEDLPPRPEFYDFALLDLSPNVLRDHRRLDELTFVVFDTETTGLLPDQGDEMVQLAACRVVNNRILSGEEFDTLVDPGRPIPASSSKVHKITDDMIADAPTPAAITRQFHRYAQDAVLVAHNALFDMSFLRRHEAELDLTFDQPVLDTVLLSAIVYGRHALHTLDALAARLDIEFKDDDRHTALGDARITAEALLRLLPILAARKIETLGDLYKAMRKVETILK